MTSPVDRDLLNRATRALRDDATSDPPDDQTGTLEGFLEPPATTPLGRAQLRQRVDESWRAMDGWRHVNRDVRKAVRRRRVGLIVALQLVAAVAGVGAWAAVSGRLPPLFSRWRPGARPPAPVAPAHARAPRGHREAFDPPAPAPPPESLPAPPPPLVQSPMVGRPVHAAPGPFRPAVPPPDHVQATSGPEEIYARAHRAQFTLHDYAGALALWDEYLATTGGTLGLEARWNRAIALVRLGRREPALAALAPFAAGQNEGYRQEEAQALLRVLGAAAP
jgi:hypothetical protein